MIMDKTLLFSENQAITGTAASTNVVDLGAARAMLGGQEIPLAITVTEAFNTLTSLTITVETDDADTFGSATTVYTTPAIPLADLTKGKKLHPPFRLPLAIKERYVRLKYTVTGANPTTGKITAGVVAGLQADGQLA